MIQTGVILPGGCASEQVEQAVLAEERGWDGVFVWEAAYGVDAWSLLAAMALRTERVKLGTLLTPLPVAAAVEGREPGGDGGRALGWTGHPQRRSRRDQHRPAADR